MYINIDIKWKENEIYFFFKIHAIFCKEVMIYGHTEKLLTSYNCTYVILIQCNFIINESIDIGYTI